MIFIVDRELSTARKFVPLNLDAVSNDFLIHAVKALKALLISYYGIRYWDIPRNYLCPPIPGGKIAQVADLIDPRASNNGK